MASDLCRSAAQRHPGVPPKVLPRCDLVAISVLSHCSEELRGVPRSTTVVRPWYYHRNRAGGRRPGRVRVVWGSHSNRGTGHCWRNTRSLFCPTNSETAELVRTRAPIQRVSSKNTNFSDEPKLCTCSSKTADSRCVEPLQSIRQL